MLKRISLGFGVLLLLAVTSYLVFNVAKVAGESAGYGKGYSAGQKVGYSAGKKDGYNLKDPTYAEALAFLAQDKTSENKYNEPVYVCTHFARDVCNNAGARGIRCAFVDIRHPGMGHAIIAFNTIDKGLAFFEPQYDEAVKPVLGNGSTSVLPR